MYSILEEAIIYSTVMHQGGLRKIVNTPSILHSLEVAQILSSMTDDQELIAAGVLHDVVEDTPGTPEEIRRRFGDRVASLVASETEENHGDEERTGSWKKRKEESLKALKNNHDIDVRRLWLADKLSNLRSLAAIFGEMGDKTWEYLNQKDSDEQLWYYRTIAEYLEMDLNRTGAYKELIGHINDIWPGTFDSRKTKYRKYREVSLDGCKRIGIGAKGSVYRYDDEVVVKVYAPEITYKDLERETTLARKAFVLGLPTAIPFGIVSVGSGYGSMFELVDAETISELIRRNPWHLEYYAQAMADLAGTLHGTEVKDEDAIPDARDLIQEWIDRGVRPDNEPLAGRLSEMVRAMPPTNHLVHGDFHMGNVFIQNNEPLFIDVDDLAVGSPIVDLGSLCLACVVFGERNPKVVEQYMGFPYETAKAFYDCFLRHYFRTDDEDRLRKRKERISVISYLRIASRLRKKEVLSEEEGQALHAALGKLESLVKTVGSLDLDIR